MDSSKPSKLINPFAFPSETNARFLLLILAIIGSTLVLADGLIGGALFIDGYILSFLGAVAITILVLWRARNLAKGDALQRIKSKQWVSFPPEEREPLKAASLNRMDQYVRQLVERIPRVNAINPEFVWDDVSQGSDQATGIAFGFGRQKYVCLRNGLHDAFIKAKTSHRFNSVLLHELGHLENQDVDKTVLSVTLGKSFFSAALIILLLFNAYFVLFFLKRLVFGDTLQPIFEAIPVFISVNIKGILILLLVEIIRSSVLRVREYYADARARVWLGQPDGFFEMFNNQTLISHVSPAQDQPINKGVRGFWKRQRKRFYTRFAPFHPTNRKRIEALLAPEKLYRPSSELAFFSGLLSGLLTNSSFIIIIGLNELWALSNNLNTLSQGIPEGSTGALLLLVVLAALQLILILLYITIAIAFLIGFGVVPIAATVGLQVQGAAFVDKLTNSSNSYSGLPKLALLSLLMGIGFVVGCLLVPIAKPFSLVGSSPTAILMFILVWALTFLIWLIPLAFIAKRVYPRHIDLEEPKRKRRFLTTLSVLALVPTFIATSMFHAGLSLKMVSPEDVPISNLTGKLLGVGILMLFLQLAIWTIGWLVMAMRGWLKLSTCPHCKAKLSKEALKMFQCPACQGDLGEWAHLPKAIPLPALPPPIQVSAAPPPL